MPQDDLLHTQLRVGQALEYAAELRFPPDVDAAPGETRVDEVLAELGLEARRDLPIERLSGGQRKRVSVALELLTTPSLLFFDEPTSGLDPGNEEQVMQLLRDLADGGRLVIVITHSVQSLDVCDRVLFLAPGGMVAYFGHPRRRSGTSPARACPTATPAYSVRCPSAPTSTGSTSSGETTPTAATSRIRCANRAWPRRPVARWCGARRRCRPGGGSSACSPAATSRC